MLNVVKAIFVLVSIFAGLAVSIPHNSCRQCFGVYGATFNKAVNQAQALAFLKTSMGDCSTGKEYDFNFSQNTGCQDRSANPACYAWEFKVNLWRYCGNGAVVILDKKNHCIGGLCANTEGLNVQCSKSVECHGNCNVVQCTSS